MILLYHTGVGGRGGPGSGGTPSACSGRARPPVASTPRTQAPGLDREHEVLPLQKAARPMDRTIRAPVQYTPAAPLHSMRTKCDPQRVVMMEGTAMVMVMIARSDRGDRLSWLVPRGEVKRRSDRRTSPASPLTPLLHPLITFKYPLLLSLSLLRRKGPVAAAAIPRHARVRRVVDADSDGLSPRPRYCTVNAKIKDDGKLVHHHHHHHRYRFYQYHSHWCRDASCSSVEDS
ncbi:hypothetical protein DFH94DRAFT_849282 [Russula ochroleuca]|uniref:Uncharacterized protein n=1 Tax=Russula ochroleuca TaxID=152965 RepID=A0A9P5JUH0_9AGAM|nr:hypothetical protein DFH94DRAFT_849282 [Russula ochroleuca]